MDLKDKVELICAEFELFADANDLEFYYSHEPGKEDLRVSFIKDGLIYEKYLWLQPIDSFEEIGRVINCIKSLVSKLLKESE